MTEAELETFAVDVWIAAGLGPQEPLPPQRDRDADGEAARGDCAVRVAAQLARGRIYKEGGLRVVG